MRYLGDNIIWNGAPDDQTVLEARAPESIEQLT